MSANPWQALDDELSAWERADRIATFWWRDDDAVAPSAALDRLLRLVLELELPLALAVVPAAAEPALARRLERHPQVAVLQHGFAHRNHALPAARKIELGGARPQAVIERELRLGRERLLQLFGERLLPVLVPPWNRLGESLLPDLAALGFAGLSTYGPRARASTHGLTQVNCHLDLIDWPGNRRFLGEAAALELLTGHLAARREGRADAEEPSGILSHHLDHDSATSDFLARLLAFLARQPAARFPAVAEVFATAGARAIASP